MKNRSIITITNYKGSKSYSLHTMTKATIWSVLALLSTIFVLNIIGILWLKQEVISLRDKRETLLGEYEKLNQRNEDLSRQITVKNTELGELQKIEEMIGIESEEKKDYSVRIDIAKHTFIERNFMLNNIPSGYPLDHKAAITSPYGYRRSPHNPRLRVMHWGIDLRARVGTPVYATAKGVVSFVGRNAGFGKLIKVWHGFGFQTYFAHLHRFKVKKGDYVNKGDIIAFSGNSGRSTGPHLHYEVRYLSRPLNPYPFLKWQLSNYDIVFRDVKQVQWNKLLSIVHQNDTTKPQQLSLKAAD